MAGENLFTVTIDAIDELISHYQQSLSPLPRFSHHYADVLFLLAMRRMDRFHLSDDKRDFEMSIFHLTQTIFLPFQPSTADSPNTVLALFFLALALAGRYRQYKQPSDIRYCIRYLHFLRDPSRKAFGVTRIRVTASLIYALALQVDLEPGNAMQLVEEMSLLCHELLLSSDLSNPEIKNALLNFSEAVKLGLLVSWIQPPQQVIECLREANRHFPDFHNISFSLSRSLAMPFYETCAIDLYDEAMAVLDKFVAHHSPTDSRSPDLEGDLRFAAGLARTRFNFYGNPEYLEEAIFRERAYLSSTSLEDSNRNESIRSLEDLEGKRVERLGTASSLPVAHSGNPEVVNLPSLSDLCTLLAESNIIGPSMTIRDSLRHFEAIDAMRHIVDKTNIEEAVKYCRLLLTSLQRCPDDKMITTYLTIGSSADLLYRAFGLTSNPEYLNESIDANRGLLKIPRAHWFRFPTTRQLISSLFARFELSKDIKDFDEAMKLYPIAATDTYGKVPDRFKISCEWARRSRASGHSSTSTAYNSAISLMQDCLAFSPTLETQHSRLITMRNSIEVLPLDYASYLVHIGQLKEAVTTLEQGRGLLWSELRGMRTSVDQLRSVDLHLAEKFTTVNRDLEALTTSGSQHFWSNDRDVDRGAEMDPFGHIVMKQRKLLDERNSIITQIRSLSGFANFLMGPSFDSLLSAAAHGPVIVINHCGWRSDIIILVDNSPPSLIPMPKSFYYRATALKNQLLAAREKGLDSTEYDAALSSVLKSLYALVGRPVIRRLQELNIPEQSRIWWCPTSVFCSLPLHAMGPVQSEASLELYFSDLYIPSYTPTLSALIESRKPGPHLLEKPPVLLVAQPDEHMPAAWNEISVIRRLNTSVTTLVSKKATPSTVMNRLQDHRFAHFSCHGILEEGKPFDACFRLYQGERLTLLEIVRSRLPSAEFAFLSACHTAELTEESIADEGLHLAAAVQYSGFRSVVGTMWAMADIDGQVLAKHFYGTLFSDRWKNVPYYERTAESLRDAVNELRRKKRVTLERWVNFVHYGA